MKRFILLFFSLFFFYNLSAQFFKDQSNIKNFKGFFNFYYDEESGKVFLEIKALKKDFLYVNSLSTGVGSNDIGLDRGQLGNGRVVQFQRYGNKILMIQPNLKYRAITDNKEEKKSVQEAFAASVLYGFPIEKKRKGVFLVDATGFLMQDAHGVKQQLERNKQGSYSVDLSKSAININRTKAFPKNVEFDVLLTFTGNPKGSEIRSVTPTPAVLTVHQHHSFVELPDDQYQPRKFDPRCGSWSVSYYDYATPVDQSIEKQFISRHRLKKKNPGSKISEAVEPIVYYIDRGAPEPIRSALIEGASWWNEAFEAIGYKNAFQVKVLPEGVDPMDLRYNVVQWVHRSTRGWSYGGSITDPRTGEIIKGHVSLGSLRIRQDFLIAQAMSAMYGDGDYDNDPALQMALARIRQLAAHELGHTLGFAHNFAASTNDRSSVMDYPHPWLKLKNDKIDFSDAYTKGIGVWDKVTVAYAYHEFSSHEQEGLQNILNSAFAKGLRYISDADARPKGSANRYAHLWDNGNDIVKELGNVLDVREFSINHFSGNNIRKGEPYSKLEDVFVPLYFYHRYQTEAVVKIIGGLDYSYALNGVSKDIVSQIDANTQREALKTVLRTVDVKTLKIPESVLKLFPPRPMGYPRTRESFKSDLGVAFDPLGAVATASKMTFDLLLQPQRISRIHTYKTMDKKQFSLDVLFDIILNATFRKTYINTYNRAVQNEINFQYLSSIFQLISDSDLNLQIKAIVLSELEDIASLLKNDTKDIDQNRYNQYLEKTIQNFIKNPVDLPENKVPEIPDGSPIGMYQTSQLID